MDIVGPDKNGLGLWAAWLAVYFRKKKKSE
jgi:hypothetical protein